MKKEYAKPDVKVTVIKAENIMALSNATTQTKNDVESVKYSAIDF